MANPKPSVSLVGKVYTRLTVLHEASVKIRGRRAWRCKCICGEETTVITSKLNNGHTRSCGCLNGDAQKATGSARRRALHDRFWEKVWKSDDGCWEWTAYTDCFGYGCFGIGREARSVGAHRISWELTYGTIPSGLWVLHRCDNPPCVRPDHLYLGTAADNSRDRYERTGYRRAS